MRHTCYFLLGALVFLAEFAGMAASAPRMPATAAELALYKGADRQYILEEGAKKEGKLAFYTTGAMQYGVQALVDAFEKKYPYIKVEIWRSAADTLMSRVLEEYKSGRYLCDVIESAQLIHVAKTGVLQPYYSPHQAAIDEGAMQKAPGEGYLTVGFREGGLVLAYNTKQISRKDIPKTYQDLLDPKWKGRMAIAGSQSGVSWMSVMLVTYGEDFVKKIAQQKIAVHMASGAALQGMVENGEYIFSPTTLDSYVVTAKQKGAPIDWHPLEPVYVNLGEMALFRQPPHPHAAMLFIDFELSKEGAAIHKAAANYTSTRRDVPGAATYKKFYGAKTAEEAAEWSSLFKVLFVKQETR